MNGIHWIWPESRFSYSLKRSIFDVKEDGHDHIDDLAQLMHGLLCNHELLLNFLVRDVLVLLVGVEQHR